MKAVNLAFQKWKAKSIHDEIGNSNLISQYPKSDISADRHKVAGNSRRGDSGSCHIGKAYALGYTDLNI